MINTENLNPPKKIVIKLKKNTVNPIKIQLKKKLILTHKLELKKPSLDSETRISVSDNTPSNEWLDQHFKHNLIYLKPSWSEVNHKIRLDCGSNEAWWDIEFLLVHFAEQLNMSCMSNPSPQWPSNPFNRVMFSSDQISYLRQRVLEANLPMNCTVYELFRWTELDSITTEAMFTSRFLEHMNIQYRFKIINHKDSQDNYLGYWVNKQTPLNLFEQRYQVFRLIPSHELDPRNGRLVERPTYKFYKKSLDLMPVQSIDFSVDNLLYYN